MCTDGMVKSAIGTGNPPFTQNMMGSLYRCLSTCRLVFRPVSLNLIEVPGHDFRYHHSWQLKWSVHKKAPLRGQEAKIEAASTKHPLCVDGTRQWLAGLENGSSRHIVLHMIHKIAS